MICQPKRDILLWWEESKKGVRERNMNGVFKKKKRKGKKYWTPVYGEKQMVDADHDKIP